MKTNTSSTPMPIMINTDIPLSIPRLRTSKAKRNKKYAKQSGVKMLMIPNNVRKKDIRVKTNTNATTKAMVKKDSLMSAQRVLFTS